MANVLQVPVETGRARRARADGGSVLLPSASPAPAGFLQEQPVEAGIAEMVPPFDLSPAPVLACCRKVLERYGRGDVGAWPRVESWTPAAGLRLCMPARLDDWEGYKLIREQPSAVNGRLGTRSAEMVVRHITTGKVWILPADDLTDARTGAAGVLAAEALAPQEPRTAAIVGAGRVARALARFLDARVHDTASPLASLHEIRVHSRTPERRARFLQDLQDTVDLPLQQAPTVDEAVAGADIILLAAASNTPVLEQPSLSRPVCVSAISGSPVSHALGLSVLEAADTIVIDQWDQCLSSGEMAEAVQQGLLDRLHFAHWSGRVAHLGDAVLGRLPRSTGISVAYLTGLALLDLAVAVEILRPTEQTGR